MITRTLYELAGEDMIDSRDLADRLDELEGMIGLDGEEDEDDLGELDELTDVKHAIGDEWQHGATMILDRYFEDYARELAEDIGAIEGDARWPATCIDWDQAARDLQMDYYQVEIAGYDYWVR